jgi:DNA-binding response OmpR family regulator
MKVLIAEDEKLLLKVLKTIFEKNGFEVVTVDNGRDGIEAIDETFDLVVTDYMMPFNTGKELMFRVKEQYNIPVIILSSLSEEDTVLTMLENGASDYIKKPFSPKELILRAKKLLE